MRLVDFVAKAQISAPTPPVRPLPPTPRLAEIGGFLPAQHFTAISFTREKKKKKKSGSAVRHFDSALGRRLQGSSRVTRVGFLHKSHSTRQHILRIRYAKTGKCMLHTTKSTSYSGCQRAPMRRFITDGHGRQHEPDIPSKTNVSDPPANQLSSANVPIYLRTKKLPAGIIRTIDSRTKCFVIE